MDLNFGRTGRSHLLSGPLSGHFLKLREDKAPVSWNMYDIEALDGHPNIGVAMPTPYVAVDIDDIEQAEKLTRLVLEQNVKCQIMQTTRGRHFWFANDTPVKNVTKTMTGIGIVADYRSWGKSSQVCIRYKGEWREWLTDYDWGEIEELPRWLRPLKQSKYKFYEMKEGDGRNAALYAYQIDLATRGFPQNEAFNIIRMINRYILPEPLGDDEIDKICRDEAYPTREKLAEESSAHNDMGERLRREMHILSYQGRLYTYRDGCYRPGENPILRAIVGKLPTSKRNYQAEVLNYLNIQCHIEKPDINEYVINCKNGRLDLISGDLLPHTPDAYDFQQIGATYDPAVYNEAVDKMLMRVFCGDYQLYKLFEELLGYCLVKNCRMQVIFIMFGDGNNGKSTLLRLIQQFIGAGNYSTLSLQDLEKPFRPAELTDKLVNLGDDIPPTTIKDSSILKSISSGEEITVERKNKDPYNLKSYATLIFTTNKMPHVNDKSFGFYRRLILMPLDARFSKTDDDYDPDISAKLSTQEAMSYMLNMAVRGLRRMIKKGFTQSDKVQKAIESYKIQSSHALSWAHENDIDTDYLLSKHTGELYFEFKSWCVAEGIENIPKQRGFTDDIKKRYELFLSNQRREEKTGRRVRYFVTHVTQEKPKNAK